MNPYSPRILKPLACMQTCEAPLQGGSSGLHALLVSTMRRARMSDGNEGSRLGEGNFAEYIARERDRLHAEREQIFTQQKELQRKLDSLNGEFQALDAYQAAKTGKPGGGRRVQTQRRAPRGSRREGLLNLIRDGNGLSRGEILERTDLKGDKAGEMSVSNALTALTKRNQVRREGGQILS